MTVTRIDVVDIVCPYCGGGTYNRMNSWSADLSFDQGQIRVVSKHGCVFCTRDVVVKMWVTNMDESCCDDVKFGGYYAVREKTTRQVRTHCTSCGTILTVSLYVVVKKVVEKNGP